MTTTLVTVTPANEQPADGAELLRLILATQQQREVDYFEAQEIGRNLVEFFEVLAGAA